MINLLTGTPGAGKTAWLVNWLLTEGGAEKRPLYIHGIPELKLPHEVIVCTSELCEPCGKIRGLGKDYKVAEQWHEWAPDSALIVLDEVQNVWRPRASSAKLPESVAKLETHRHKGIDFWMISQGPHLFDSNVRRLIGRHVHLKSTSLGRFQYEWPECRENTQSTGDAVRRGYTLPKRVFGMYKSASLHTKQVHRKPLSFYVLFACLVSVGLISWRVASRISEVTEVKPVPAAGVSLGEHPSPGLARTEQAGDQWTPRVKGRPETAPAYDGLLKVSAVPNVSACILSASKGCQCFTAQATPYPMPDAVCREYVSGHVFNPYKLPDLPVSPVKAVPSSRDDRGKT